MRWIPALAILAQVAGCFGQKDTLGLPCNFDAQCDLGQACVMGECRSLGDETGATTPGESTTDGCMSTPIELAPLPARVVLVLDRSAATALAWDDDGDAGTPTLPRWDSVRAAVMDQLPAVDDSTELGLVLAPAAAATDACMLDAAATLAIAPGNAAAIVSALPSDAQGGAPLTGAFTLALADLAAQPGPGSRAVVLVLAGAANCANGLDVYDAQLEAIVAAGLEMGVPTVVVGVGPSEETAPVAIDDFPDGVSPHMVAMALADLGGRPRPPDSYYRASNGINLVPAVRDALFAARGCVLPRPDGVNEVDDVQLRLDGDAVPRIDTCDAPGFVVRSDALEICGTWCSALKLGATAEVTVGCD